MWRRSPTSSPEGGLRALLAPALLAALLAAVPDVASGSAGPADLEDLAQEILASRSYQRTMPDGSEGGIRIPVRVGGLARLLVYGLIAYALFLVVAWGWREMRGGRSASSAEAGADRAPSGSAGAGSLAHADPGALARAGRHAEAVHAMLLLVIGHLALRAAKTLSPAATSRELLRTLPRTPEEREAFAFLVRQVELSIFGGRPTGTGEYEAARRRLAAFGLPGIP